MKAVVYNGPRDVRVSDVPDAKIERPTDVLVSITSTNICGSDLHMYEGRTDFEPGRILGHENLGEVVEVGTGVGPASRSATGWCCRSTSPAASARTANAGLTNYCLTTNPDPEMAGRRVRLRRHGPVERRPGGATAGALRRLQLPCVLPRGRARTRRTTT